jgi:hypothetical protein
MKKLSVFTILVIAVVVFSKCHSARKAMVVKPKINYTTDIQTLIVANCSPCHIPAKGGRKLPLDTYVAVNKNIDDMLRRIQLNPGEKGFMPDKRVKLNDSTINVFKQWKVDGQLEK